MLGFLGSFCTSAFGPSKSQKAHGSQKLEAHYSELLGFLAYESCSAFGRSKS